MISKVLVQELDKNKRSSSSKLLQKNIGIAETFDIRINGNNKSYLIHQTYKY